MNSSPRPKPSVVNSLMINTFLLAGIIFFSGCIDLQSPQISSGTESEPAESEWVLEIRDHQLQLNHKIVSLSEFREKITRRRSEIKEFYVKVDPEAHWKTVTDAEKVMRKIKPGIRVNYSVLDR